MSDVELQKSLEQNCGRFLPLNLTDSALSERKIEVTMGGLLRHRDTCLHHRVGWYADCARCTQFGTAISSTSGRDGNSAAYAAERCCWG